MAKRSPRYKGSAGRRPASSEPPATPEPPPKPKPAPVPAPAAPVPAAAATRADSNLSSLGFVIIGAVGGGVTGFANWGMTPLAAVTGLVAGLSMGATVGHSLKLPGQFQTLVLTVMVILCFVLYAVFGHLNAAPVGLAVAGGASLVLSYLLQQWQSR